MTDAALDGKPCAGNLHLRYKTTMLAAGSKSRLVVTVGCAIGAWTLLAGTAVWTPGATSLADGAVTVEYADGLVTRLVAALGAETLTLTGTDAIAFASDATLSVSNGTLRLEAPVTGAGALTVTSPRSGIVFDSTTDYLPQAEADAVVIAEGLDLDDFNIDHACCAKNGLGYYYGNSDYNVQAYFVERGEGTLVCQLQHLSDAWNKCIFLHLKQDGDRILAWTPEVYYANYSTTPAPLGTDFRTIAKNAMPVSSVALKRSGYGVDALYLICARNIDAVEVAAGLAPAGTLTVDAGVTLTADGPTALTGAETWNVPLVLKGGLKIRNPDGLRLGGKVSYGKYGRLDVVSDGPMAAHPFVCEAPDWPNGTWTTIATNCCLAAVTNVTAMTGGGSWFDSGVSTPLTTYFFENDGKTVTSQHMYYPGTYIKGCVYQLRQVGGYVQARILKSGYKATSSSELGKVNLITDGTNMDIYDGGANGKSNGYGLKTIRVYFGDSSRFRTIKLGGAVTSAGTGQMSFSAREEAPLYVEGVAANALMASLDVGAYVSLSWNVSGYNAGSSITTFRIREKGEFFDVHDWSWEPSTPLVISGGVYRVHALSSATSNTVSGIYLNNVTFENGGRVTEHMPRTGYYADMNWTVRGASPAYIDCGLGVVGNGPTNELRTLTFDVSDVTGDDEPDLYVSGNLYYSNDAWKMAQTVKTGAGTLIHYGLFSVNSYPLVLRDGVWRVTRPNGIVSGCAVQFDGGTLAVDAGCSQALGAVTLAEKTASTVALGAGVSLTLANLTAGTGSSLDFTLPDSTTTVRIGTTRCLPAATVKCLTINGGCVHQNASGYLREGGGGTLVMLN